VLSEEVGGQTGIGFTYSDASIVGLIQHTFAACVLQRVAWNISAMWLRMQEVVRNLGSSGLAATAISAIETEFPGG
jgi:hypothetical protein